MVHTDLKAMMIKYCVQRLMMLPVILICFFVVCVCVCMCVCVCVCMHACVQLCMLSCVQERERDRQRGTPLHVPPAGIDGKC